jgi:hypothetical protein
MVAFLAAASFTPFCSGLFSIMPRRFVQPSEQQAPLQARGLALPPGETSPATLSNDERFLIAQLFFL